MHTITNLPGPATMLTTMAVLTMLMIMVTVHRWRARVRRLLRMRIRVPGRGPMARRTHWRMLPSMWVTVVPPRGPPQA